MKNNTTKQIAPQRRKQTTPFGLNAIYWLVMAFLLFISLQTRYSYYFYYIEQLQLFPLTLDHFIERICIPGGFNEYVAGFILQFYGLPYTGAFFTTLLFLTGGMLLQRILKKLSPDTSNFILAALPMLLQVPLLLDMSYRLQETIAFLCMLAFFYLFLCLSNSRKRLMASAFMPILLFWLAGPSVTLWVASIIIWGVFRGTPSDYGVLISLPILASIACLSVFESWQYSFWNTFIPHSHFEETTSSSSFPYYVCSTYLLSLLLSAFLGKYIHIGQKNRMSLIAFQLTASLLCVWGIINRKSDPLLLYKMEQDHYLQNRQWQKIISTFQQSKYDLQTINILNLALAKQGRLDKELFKYPQRGGETLLANWDELLPGAIAQAELHYHIGNIGAAQKYAYEGYIISRKGNPRLLKRLVETNLIFGAYPVAEKYITILEQTLFYQDWAHEQRKYLYNDPIVEADWEYGHKRRALKRNPDETVSLNFIQVLEYLAVSDPENPLPLLYLTTYHLLNKDLVAFNTLYNKYYHTPVWPTLTIRQQEAVAAWHEDEQALWLEKGVDPETGQRFISYKNEMLHLPPYSNPEKKMATSFGDTYWYYLLFKE